MTGVLLAGSLPAYADPESPEPACGLTEHVHTEACYTAVEPASLNCVSVDPHLQNIHKHTEYCYDKEGRLICGYADFVLHTHTEACYNSQGQLICQIPENKGHQHEDACYSLVDVLVCQEKERPAVAGHQHTEACYTLVNTGNLVCGQQERAADAGHVHTEACYTLVNTGNLVCGQNERAADPGHVHTEACYSWVNTGNLICGQAERAADPGYYHNEACYDEAGNLICGQQERAADPGHVHTEDCYEHVQQLSCGQEERAADPGHTHTEECYEHVQQLTCGQEERAADPGHTHTEECYEHVQQLTCGQEESAGDPGHIHTAACYQQQRVLICGQPESYTPHVHTEACYEKDDKGNLTGVLICGKAEVFDHVHTEACIPQTETVLTCGLAEHQHTAECFPAAGAEEEPEAQPEEVSETEARSTVEAGESDLVLEQDPGKDTASGDEAEAEAETEAETEADKEAETEAETEADKEAETEAETEADKEAETEAETEAEKKTEAEAETEAETEGESGLPEQPAPKLKASLRGAGNSISAEPEFTLQPESTSAAVGKQAELTAEADNAESYQWKYSKDGERWYNLPEGSAFAGTKTNSLTVTQSTARSAYSYKLTATGAGGTTDSDIVTIALITAPKFTLQPKSTGAAVGEQATLTAEAENADSYQWKYSKDGERWYNLPESDALIGTQTNSLTVTQSTARSTYSYKLAATGEGGTTYSTVVKVYLPPKFTLQPESTSATVGKQATLTAEVSNASSYQWKYSRDGETWYRLSESSAFVGTQTTSLTVTQSTVRSTYSYKLEAKGDGGKTDSEIVKISLGSAPEFTVQPESTSAAIGKKATLTAEVSNAETYQWKYSRDGSKWYNLSESNAFTGTQTNSLTILQSAARSAYSYKLTATGEGGHADSDIVTVSLGSVPEFTVQPESTSAAVGEQATLTAEVSNATSLQWKYSRDGETWYRLSESSAFVGTKTNSLTITQSTARSAYSYKLTATGDGGTADSDIVTVTLGNEAAPEFTLQPESTRAAVGEQATLTAEVSHASAYQWKYSTDGENWSDLEESSDFVGTQTASLTVTQSKQSADYQYQLTATGAGGEAVSEAVTVILYIVVDDVTYEILPSSKCKVFSYAGTASALTIPDSVEGLNVIEIGEEAFMDNSLLASIDLPDSITVIRARAFKNCTSLSQMN